MLLISKLLSRLLTNLCNTSKLNANDFLLINKVISIAKVIIFLVIIIILLYILYRCIKNAKFYIISLLKLYNSKQNSLIKKKINLIFCIEN